MSDSFLKSWIVPHLAPVSMGLSRNNSGMCCPFLLHGIILAWKSNACVLCLLHLQVNSSLLSHWGNLFVIVVCLFVCLFVFNGSSSPFWKHTGFEFWESSEFACCVWESILYVQVWVCMQRDEDLQSFPVAVHVGPGLHWEGICTLKRPVHKKGMRSLMLGVN